MAPERLSSRTSFSLDEEFLDTSDSLVRCVLHQNIIVFIQVLFVNEQTEFTAWSNQGTGQEGHIRLNYRMCPKLFLEGKTHHRTKVCKSHSFTYFQIRHNMHRLGITVVGWYHSHPHSQADPRSETWTHRWNTNSNLRETATFTNLV